MKQVQFNSYLVLVILFSLTILAACKPESKQQTNIEKEVKTDSIPSNSDQVNTDIHPSDSAAIANDSGSLSDALEPEIQQVLNWTMVEGDGSMNWYKSSAMYLDYPLLLSKPSHPYIWGYKEQCPNLFHINLKFSKALENGLPESDYNTTLYQLDRGLVSLFDMETEGILFLIETYGGTRNYWYLISAQTDYIGRSDSLFKAQAEHELTYKISTDLEWAFFENYPFILYTK